MSSYVFQLNQHLSAFLPEEESSQRHVNHFQLQPGEVIIVIFSDMLVISPMSHP